MRKRTHTSPKLGRRELDVVTKWALVVLVIVALLTAGYTLIHAAARIEETDIRLSASLPANYRDTLLALLVSADAPCSEVCDLTATHAETNRTTFSVSCAVGRGADACAQPQTYTLTLEPAPVASR